MQNNEIDYSRGVLLYRGYNISSFPTWNYAALVEEFGADIAECLLGYIENISHEVDSLKLDWVKSPTAAAVITCREISARHPELSEEALRAIVWNSSYSNR